MRAAALAALLALLPCRHARAEDGDPVVLHWVAPAECPHEGDVMARLRGLAGPSRSPDGRVHAEATVARRDDGRFHLALVVRAGGLVGERHIDASSCADLAGATAVALALLVRSAAPLDAEALAGRDGTTADGASAPAADGGEPPEAPAREDAAPPAREAAPPAPPPPSGDRSPPRSVHVLLRAPHGAFALGPLPAPAFGLGGAAGLAFGRARVLLAATAWGAQRPSAPDEPGVSADLRRLDGHLQACWALVQWRLEVAPCLTLGVEHLRSRGRGEHIASREGSVTWASAGVGAQARWSISSWFGLFGGMEARVEGSRARVAIDGVGTLVKLSPASLTVTFGPEWIL